MKLLERLFEKSFVWWVISLLHLLFIIAVIQIIADFDWMMAVAFGFWYGPVLSDKVFERLNELITEVENLFR